MRQIIVSDIKIDVIKKDIRNLHLSVNPPNGKVKIASPLRIDDEAIRLFAVAKIPWIRKQQKKFEEQARQSKRDFVLGESHYYKGVRYLLDIKEYDTFRKNRVELTNKKIILHVRKKTNEVQRKNLVENWHRKELKNEMDKIIPNWEKRIGVNANEWNVRIMKTKWGSCITNKKKININLELIKKPIECLEYIIVHELIHLIERKHTEKFTELMTKYLPNWKFLREELNNYPISHGEWEY